MANLQVINIVIKAYLPTGKTLDEQFEALSKVKEAHKTGDYSELLKVATIEEVKTEQKTRRFEDAPHTQEQGAQDERQDVSHTDDPDFAEIDGQEETQAEEVPADLPLASDDDWSQPLTEEEKQEVETTSRRGRKAS